jgi:hypothetical protein
VSSPILPSRDKPGSDAALAAFYALGVLDPALWAQTEQRCVHDTIFAARVRAWESRTDVLDAVDPALPAPSAALWERIAARLDAPPPQRATPPLAWDLLAPGIARTVLSAGARGDWTACLLWLGAGSIPFGELFLEIRELIPINGQYCANKPTDQDSLLFLRR